MVSALSPPRVRFVQARGIYVMDLMGNGAEVSVVHTTAKTELQRHSCFSEQVLAAVNGCGESVWNHRIIKVGNVLQDHQLQWLTWHLRGHH